MIIRGYDDDVELNFVYKDLHNYLTICFGYLTPSLNFH